MAKRFMFVCFGILALPLAYNLGSQRADAQGSGTISAAFIGAMNGDGTLAVVGRTLYFAGDGISGLPFPTGPIPGSDPVIAVGMVPNHTLAILANGDVYRSLNGAAWTFAWNVVGSPTPATRSTWGALKAKYHN